MEIACVDAFARQPFEGNPAAVCVLDQPRSTAWMQSVAAEMNLAETAFVEPRAGAEFGLRWFTPTVEVDLCGHATLASAHVAWQRGESAAVLGFQTRSGRLTATRTGRGIRLDLPADPPAPVPRPPGLAQALGVEPVSTARGRAFLLVEVAGAGAVRALAPDLAALRALDVAGVIVTAPGEDGADVVSRFFAPRLGIDEDPVTGAAHCILGPYWCDRLGRDRLVAYQASRRGGFVDVEVQGQRVLLTGQAVTVWTGDLRL